MLSLGQFWRENPLRLCCYWSLLFCFMNGGHGDYNRDDQSGRWSRGVCVCTQMQTYTHTLYQSLWEVLLFSSGSLTDTLAQGELSERRPLSGSARRDMQGRFRHLI